MTIGERIRQLREQRGWSLSEAARQLKAQRGSNGRSYLHQIEHGDSSPTLQWIEHAATTFGISTLELLAPLYGGDVEAHEAREKFSRAFDAIHLALGDLYRASEITTAVDLSYLLTQRNGRLNTLYDAASTHKEGDDLAPSSHKHEGM